MKHYEMILEYKVKTIQKSEREKIEKKKYGLINYDEKMDKNEQIEYRLYKMDSGRDISYGKKQEATKNINSFLQKINTENNAICLTNIDDDYLTFIGATKSDKNEDIENILHKTYEYLQNNISHVLPVNGYYEDDEIKYIELSEKFIYKEISAKEFLIDNIYELINDTDNSVIVQKYFEILNEHNYNVRELGYRKNSLNYDFISSMYIEKMISKEKLLNKYKSIQYNDNLRQEIDRIYNNKRNKNIQFNPFHYEVYAENNEEREEIYKCIGTALYNNGRIQQRNILKLRLDLNNNFVSNQSIKTILKNEEGALVCIEFYMYINNKAGKYEEIDQIHFNELIDIIDEYKDKTEFIFYFDKYQKEMKNQVLEALHNIKLIKIKNIISLDKINEYVDKTLEEKGLLRDERLDNLLKTANRKLNLQVINNIINTWQNEKYVSIYYPEYDEFIKKNEEEKKDNANAYKKFMSMIGLSNVKKLINQIIDYYKIEKIKDEKFLEEKNESIVNSTYKIIKTPLHMAFLGNPGTAKTTVANLLAEIFYENGLIRSAKCIQFNQKNILLEKAFKLAYGGILFIDEAYQYTCPMSDFVSNLVELMEVNRNDVIVILAGYKNEMEDFLHSNPGFESRVKYKIVDIGKNPKNEFYNLIGLTNAKRIIEKIIASVKVDITRKKLCEEKDNENLIKSPMHLAFLGNPGTAKTTVARLFARILKEENIIKNPNIVEVGRKDLIGQYVGQTAPLVKKAFDKAKGGILFIDEAYALLDEYKGGYGEEAINTIIQEMENRRNEVIVIFAGYTDRMKEFIDNNEGMKSRINYLVEFDDYTSDELVKIFVLICENKKLLYKSSLFKYIKTKFAEITERSDFTTLGNGRFVRKIIEAAKLNMDYRLSLLREEKLDKISINTLTKTDVEKAIEDLLENMGKVEMQKLGFAA